MIHREPFEDFELAVKLDEKQLTLRMLCTNLNVVVDYGVARDLVLPRNRG